MTVRASSRLVARETSRRAAAQSRSYREFPSGVVTRLRPYCTARAGNARAWARVRMRIRDRHQVVERGPRHSQKTPRHLTRLGPPSCTEMPWRLATPSGCAHLRRRSGVLSEPGQLPCCERRNPAVLRVDGASRRWRKGAVNARVLRKWHIVNDRYRSPVATLNPTNRERTPRRFCTTGWDCAFERATRAQAPESQSPQGLRAQNDKMTAALGAARAGAVDSLP